MDRGESELSDKKIVEAADGPNEHAAVPKTGTYSATRSTSATVLFFDVVGYTKQSVNKQIEIKNQFNHLVSDCLKAQGESERIILDTGDGAAIGFMQHPEDALQVAMKFRQTVMSNQHRDYPDLKVRIGIHLGPINVAKDMNGRNNMVGDGINDAQRVMSFAGNDQIFISRSYYDFISRLCDEYANLFHYRGAKNDKHGREHLVYELVDAAESDAGNMQVQAVEPVPAITFEPFSFVMPEAVAATAPETVNEPGPVQIPVPENACDERKIQRQDDALLNEIAQMNWADEPAEAISREQKATQKTPAVPQALPADIPTKPAPPKEADNPVAHKPDVSDSGVPLLAKTEARVPAENGQQKPKFSVIKAECAVQQETDQPPVVQNIRVERIRRKPMPWGKFGIGFFLALLIALFVVPPLLPMRNYATGIEQMLAATLQQPVHIGQMAVRLLPTPQMELGEISVGETRQIQAKQARISFPISSLFSSNHSISGIELEGVQVNDAPLQLVALWVQKIAADSRYPVARIGLSQSRLEAGSVQLSGIGGELNFDRAGKFVTAKLHAEGNKLALDINATAENKMQVSFVARNSALPLLPNWVFDELTAKGELVGDELVIAEVDSRIMGGMLLGNARIGWHSGWRADGTLTAKVITMQNMSRALSGDMDGTAHFQMRSENLSGLVETAAMEGVFAIKKGVINGFDIVETARLRSKENLPGGRTHFDELSGDFAYANGNYRFRQIKMNAGVLNANGSLDIAKQQVSGRVVADLSRIAGMSLVTLQLDGKTDSLLLHVAP